MSVGPQAAFVTILNFANVAKDEFDAWLDTEHFPERLRVPGFMNAERWVAHDGSTRSLALYDLKDLAVIRSAAYEAVTGPNLSPWSRRVIGRCERQRFDLELMARFDKPVQQPANGLLFVAMDVAPEAEQDFNHWYDQEHVPRLFSIDGVMSARRYRAPVGSPRYIATYHTTTPEVADSDEWKVQIDSRWGDRVRPHTSNRFRIVCRRYEPAAQAREAA